MAVRHQNILNLKEEQDKEVRFLPTYLIMNFYILPAQMTLHSS